MTWKLKVGLGAAAALLIIGIGAWFLGTWLHLEGQDLWILRGGLWLLGTIAVAVLAWVLLRRSAKVAKSSPDEDNEIDAAVAAARSRLGKSRVVKAGALQDLPVLLVLGSDGSTKTTIVVRSSLDAELLAGEAFRGDTVVPTRSLNIWYSKGVLLLEAASKVVADSSRWTRLVHYLRPRRLRAAVTGGNQAPRSAIVCFSCEEFSRPDSSEAVPNAARALRARLSEVALELGVRLPVYVAFTKADCIPHFPDYVRNFSADEVREVFGSTLPLEAKSDKAYAEHTFKRIEQILQRLFQSLALQRLNFLRRETIPQAAGGAYEFPREFRKIIPLATQFLVDLCRPSQLEVSPVLRGFYFVGVRPVMITETPSDQNPQSLPGRDQFPIRATSVFKPEQAGRVALMPKMTSAQSTRKVPQWVFLEQLLPEIVLGDRAALSLGQGGRRVAVVRRALLGSAIAIAAALALGFLVSFLGNRQLLESVTASAHDLAALQPASSELATLDALTRLDRGRVELERLSAYEQTGVPWHLRWGLYAGAALYPSFRRHYFAIFDRLVFGATRDSLTRSLRSLPERPDQRTDYNKSYASLKAYVATTVHPEKSSASWLTPILLDRWHGTTAIDAPRATIARGLFDFYADELRRDNPYKVPDRGQAADSQVAAIAHARQFLGQFTVIEPIYQSMVAEVSGRIPSVKFDQPGAGIVWDPYEVRGAFTQDGWKAMQAAFKNADRFFTGEAWVMGNQTSEPEGRAKALAQLRAIYLRDYIGQWRTFLGAATVQPFTSVQEGARNLAVLSGNQSPLLALFSLVSRHTAVDTVDIGAAFQPVQVVTPAKDTAKFIGPSNEPYINALGALQASLERISKGTPEEADAVLAQATTDAAQARTATKQIANKFRIDGVAKVDVTVQKLMEAPIKYAEAALQTVGPAQLSAKGKAFCAPFQQLLTKYPFNPAGSVPAGLDEVSGLLQPGTGFLWTSVQGQLANVVVRQGSQFAEKPGSTVRVSPAFLAFLNRAADFSSTLFGGEGAQPGLKFSMRPTLSEEVPELAITIDGRTARFSRSSTASQTISWAPGEEQDARLSGQFAGQDRELSFRGSWAIFKLFEQADWIPQDGFYLVEWQLAQTARGEPLRARFNVNLPPGAKPILQGNFFGGVNCSGRIAR